MTHRWPIPVLVLLIGVSVVLNWANQPERRTAPPAMTAAQILATPESQVFSLVTQDLRWKLAACDASLAAHWRTMPAPACHVLALAAVERDEGPDRPAVFEGFAFIINNPYPTAPNLSDIAEAYTAIGATAPVAVVDKASRLAAASAARASDAHPGQPSVADPFGELNRQLLEASAKAGTNALIRIYIRAHADEIASAQIKT